MLSSSRQINAALLLMCLGYLTLSYSSRRINRLFEERLAKDAFIWFASKPASYSKRERRRVVSFTLTSSASKHFVHKKTSPILNVVPAICVRFFNCLLIKRCLKTLQFENTAILLLFFRILTDDGFGHRSRTVNCRKLNHVQKLINSYTKNCLAYL